jgi:hypothetical protein
MIRKQYLTGDNGNSGKERIDDFTFSLYFGDAKARG